MGVGKFIGAAGVAVIGASSEAPGEAASGGAASIEAVGLMPGNKKAGSVGDAVGASAAGTTIVSEGAAGSTCVATRMISTVGVSVGPVTIASVAAGILAAGILAAGMTAAVDVAVGTAGAAVVAGRLAIGAVCVETSTGTPVSFWTLVKVAMSCAERLVRSQHKRIHRRRKNAFHRRRQGWDRPVAGRQCQRRKQQYPKNNVTFILHDPSGTVLSQRCSSKWLLTGPHSNYYNLD